MESILKEAKGQYRVLYALLAGCGPARSRSARPRDWQTHLAKIAAPSTTEGEARELQLYTKTPNGTEIFSDGELLVATWTSADRSRRCCEFIGNRTSGLLFCTSTGNQLLQSATLEDSLHPLLKKIEHEQGGFNKGRE